MTSCGGCGKNILDLNYLECANPKCSLMFDLTCLNKTKQQFDSFTDEYKAAWLCPSCDRPKKGDNSGTPVRTAHNDTFTKNVNFSRGGQSQKSNAGAGKPENEDSILENCSCLTADQIKEIFRFELQANNIVLRKEFREIRREIEDKINSFEKSITYFNSAFEEIRANFTAQKEELAKLNKENETLRDSVRDLTSRFQQIDQLSRATNIEIQCVPENRNEHLISTVQQLGTAIKCPVQEQDIHYCSRVAKQKSDSPRPRNILVKFSSPRLRDSFLAATITFNKNNKSDKLNTSHLGIADDKRTPIYVSENLSPELKNLHAEARKRCIKDLGYKFVWVRNGRIFARKTEDSNYVYIRDTASLKLLT
ncbi:hypothetical protein NE865_12940 [Phthorimaea operculella]|nr:hypothetical protein NE865_12940 [Phthorimaea operculella]